MQGTKLNPESDDDEGSEENGWDAKRAPSGMTSVARRQECGDENAAHNVNQKADRMDFSAASIYRGFLQIGGKARRNDQADGNDNKQKHAKTSGERTKTTAG